MTTNGPRNGGSVMAPGAMNVVSMTSARSTHRGNPGSHRAQATLGVAGPGSDSPSQSRTSIQKPMMAMCSA